MRDPVHDYVGIPHELVDLVAHPYIQRLRRIAQTSMSSAAYPSMNGRRYEHSLGAMHLSVRAWDTAWENSLPSAKLQFSNAVREFVRELGPTASQATRQILLEEPGVYEVFGKTISLAVAAVALTHDIGHPPFSHALEGFYQNNAEWILSGITDASQRDSLVSDIRTKSPRRPLHETAGRLILQAIEESAISDIPIELVTEIEYASVKSQSWSGALHSLVAGEVDVDRLDYLLRDAKNSGTEYGSFDKERLLQSIELHELENEGDYQEDDSEVKFAVGFGLRAQSALESFIHQRYQYYRWVVYHHHSVAANRFLNLTLHYLMEASDVDYHDGGLHEVPRLNYFGIKNHASVNDRKQLAQVDDSTIMEWIKTRLIAENGKASDIGGQQATNIARKRFIALADITVHHETSWVALWKTSSDFHSVAKSLSTGLNEKYDDLKRDFDRWCENNPTSFPLQALGKRRLEEISRGLAKGDTQFLNSIAKNFLAATAKYGLADTRQVIAADDFGRLAGTHRFSNNGFWVFAYNSIDPWRDEHGTYVFKGNDQQKLWQLSSPALAGYGEMEAARPQFYCYFVEPDYPYGAEKLATKALAAFARAFPIYFYNELRIQLGIDRRDQ